MKWRSRSLKVIRGNFYDVFQEPIKQYGYLTITINLAVALHRQSGLPCDSTSSGTCDPYVRIDVFDDSVMNFNLDGRRIQIPNVWQTFETITLWGESYPVFNKNFTTRIIDKDSGVYVSIYDNFRMNFDKLMLGKEISVKDLLETSSITECENQVSLNSSWQDA